MLHDAVLARCDLDDGVKDGIVGDPHAACVGCHNQIAVAGMNEDVVDLYNRTKVGTKVLVI